MRVCNFPATRPAAVATLIGTAFFLNLLGPRSAWFWAVLGVIAGLAFELALLSRHRAASPAPEGKEEAEGLGNKHPEDLQPVPPTSTGTRNTIGTFLLRGASLIGGLSLTLWASGYYLRVESPSKSVRQYQKRTGVFVSGNLNFQRAVCDALLLLDDQAPDKFRFVTGYVVVVAEGSPEGANIWVDPPIVLFTNAPKSDSIWSNSIWYASALVHEAKHIELLRRSQRRHDGGFICREVGGVTAELDANEMQAETLRQLRSPQYQIDAVENDLGAHWSDMMGPSNAARWADDDTLYHPLPLKTAEPVLWKELLRFRRELIP